jgi:molecular chaperone GrpE
MEERSDSQSAEEATHEAAGASEVDVKAELEAKIEDLKRDLEAEKKRNSDQASRMKYLQADLINLQRQTDRMVADARSQVKLNWILEMISIKEDIQRALDIAAAKQDSTMTDGLNMVLSRIEATLQSEDVHRIKVSAGQSFDPKLHEAVAFAESETEDDGKILSVISSGYTMGGKVIKPALVEVARRSASKESPVTDLEKETKTTTNFSDESDKIENAL